MEYAVLGIGLNVLANPGLAPTPFVPGTTRLMDWMKHSSTDTGNRLLASLSRQLLDCVQARLAQLYRDGQASLVQNYRQASILTGRRICIFSEREDGSDDVPGTLLGRGVITDIGEGLELLLDGVSGPITRGRAALEVDCIRQGWFQHIPA
jgi:biotin-(acetyl-CoA carboxylase) ligase